MTPTTEKLIEEFYKQFPISEINWRTPFSLQNDLNLFLRKAFEEIRASEREEVKKVLMGMKKEIDYDTYCGCDGECFSACRKSFNNALDEAIAKL